MESRRNSEIIMRQSEIESELNDSSRTVEQIDTTGVNFQNRKSVLSCNDSTIETLSIENLKSISSSELNQSQYYQNFGPNGLLNRKNEINGEREEGLNSEPLLGGFALLRAVQLLNFDIYYLGLTRKFKRSPKLNDRFADPEIASPPKLKPNDSFTPEYSKSHVSSSQTYYYTTVLDELANYNPLQKYINKYSILGGFCRLLKICLSLFAIITGIDKTISNIILCLTSNIENKGGDAQEQANSSMALSVLILVNISSIYILFSTVFNGHILWNLLSQRLFLVSKKFQFKTMLILLTFIYLEYIVSIAFVNNLYEWDFTSNNIQSGSYSVFANLRIFLTEQDEEHYYIDILLTIVQFTRGIIRISPYITINYAMVCLREHIRAIRNQHILTDSLKKRQKLRLVVTNRSRKIQDGKNGIKKKKVNFVTDLNGQTITNQTITRKSTLTPVLEGEDLIKNLNEEQEKLRERESMESIYRDKISKDVNIQSSSTISLLNSIELNRRKSLDSTKKLANGITDEYIDAFKQLNKSNETNLDNICLIDDIKDEKLMKENKQFNINHASLVELKRRRRLQQQQQQQRKQSIYLDKISDFDELESYITNLYIFTGRFNRVMSRQGLTVFFIVHNLVITVSLIVPEAVRGGTIMAYFIRFLVILIGIMPFVIGESLNEQLEQLSKQIDRIIIQQQFIHTRRDNLVRIRELIHDIRVNCGGMLNFNMETGIKYLVVAFASAFFIEQERK